MYISRGAKYEVLISSIGGIVLFLILYFVMTNNLSFNGIKNQNADLLTAMVFGIVIALTIVAVLCIRSIIKEKEDMELNQTIDFQQAANYQYVPCPKCGISNTEKVDYLRKGGFQNPRLVNQVRCRSCGKTYDGITGKTITNSNVIYGVIGFVIVILLTILRILF